VLALFFAPGASSMAPHIALHEIGCPFEPCPISFAKREQRSPEFRRLNPEGKVPLLLVEGRPLTEVAGILWYLARRYPDAGLLTPPTGSGAADAEAEAEIVSWMSFLASTIHPARQLGREAGIARFRLAEERLG
jgi:glutathione S-transferase